MEPRSNNPDAPGPWDQELPDLLRAAVGQLRDELPPLDACRRALDVARRIGTPPPRRTSAGYLACITAGRLRADLPGLAWRQRHRRCAEAPGLLCQ